MKLRDGDTRCPTHRRRFLRAALLAGLARVLPVRAAPIRARVLVAGGGFAGASCALALRRLEPSIDVTLVDPDPSYATGPMSNAVIAGWRSIESITVSRSGLARAGVRIRRDRVVANDPVRRRVWLGGGDSLDYERLVVAPGIRMLWGSPEGYDEAAAQRMPHAWLPGTQTTLLAAQLRAIRDGGVVAISVPSGLMRCPPGPFERASVVAAWLKSNKPRAKVLIFDANNHFPKQDIFSAAWRELYPGLIEWIPSTEGGTVERVDVRQMTLHASRGAQHVDVASVIPRQAPGQIAVDLGLASGHGWCPVDTRTFESTLVPGVHVIGDACIAGAMPKAASAAHSQALQCARAIVSALRETAMPEPQFDSLCYSLLARDRAVSFHGKFEIADGDIRDAAVPLPTRQPSAQEEAQFDEAWYRKIVADSFGI